MFFCFTFYEGLAVLRFRGWQGVGAEAVPQGRHADELGGIVGGRRHTLPAQHPLRSLRMPKHDHLPSSATAKLFFTKIAQYLSHIFLVALFGRCTRRDYQRRCRPSDATAPHDTERVT